jgi:hypothetical protein
VPEFKILSNIIAYMETNGATSKTVTLSIDQDLTDEINTEHKTHYTLDDLQRAAAKCLAHEWIERTSLDRMYTNLRITPKGIGVAQSKAKSDELKASRSWLKKTSDYIEDHKGLFVVFGFLLALATFASKFFGIK